MTPREIHDEFINYDPRLQAGFLAKCMLRTLPICRIHGNNDLAERAIGLADSFARFGLVEEAEIESYVQDIADYFADEPQDPSSKVIAAAELVVKGIAENALKVKNVLNTLDWAIESADVPSGSDDGVEEEEEWREMALAVLSDQGDSVDFESSFSHLFVDEPKWVTRFLADVYKDEPPT